MPAVTSQRTLLWLVNAHCPRQLLLASCCTIHWAKKPNNATDEVVYMDCLYRRWSYADKARILRHRHGHPREDVGN